MGSLGRGREGRCARAGEGDKNSCNSVMQVRVVTVPHLTVPFGHPRPSTRHSVPPSVSWSSVTNPWAFALSLLVTAPACLLSFATSGYCLYGRLVPLVAASWSPSLLLSLVSIPPGHCSFPFPGYLVPLVKHRPSSPSLPYPGYCCSSVTAQP